MLQLIQKVVVNGYEFSNINNGSNLPLVFNIKISSNRKTIVDTATIEIANRFVGYPNKKASDFFEIGSKVEIWLGYFGYTLTKEFVGYISSIVPNFNCIINCENEAYVYKRTQVQKSYTTYGGGVKISELLSEVYPKKNKITGSSSKYIYPKNDPNVGQWCVQKGAMIFDILEEIKKTFSLYSFYRDDTLVVGGGINDDDRDKEQQIIVDFQGNVPQGSNGLNITLASNDNAIVKGEIRYRDGEGILLYARYKVGSSTEIEYLKELEDGQYNCLVGEINLGIQDPELAGTITQPNLEQMLERKLQAISYDGVFGDVVIFGYPSVKHGDIAWVKNVYLPEIEGSYKVVGVDKEFSTTGGFRQKLLLAQRLSKGKWY